MLAIVYGRVSTETQAMKGFSLPEQMRECREKAGSLGATDILEFTDDVSGDTLDRPGFNNLREVLRRGGVRWFICYDPDRLARSLIGQLVATDEIEAAGTELVFVQHDYQNTPEGALFLQMRGSISEFEKAKIRERTARGRKGKMRKGGIPGWVDTYGYDFVKGEGRLAVNEEQAAWVRRIYDWYINDQRSIRRIVEDLNDLGAPPPRGEWWYRVSVTRILKNVSYTGILYLNRYDTARAKATVHTRSQGSTRKIRDQAEWIPVTVPAIISTDQFERAQEVLARSRYSRGVDSDGHLLSGMVRCGRCGNTIRYKNNSRWARYFACSRRFEYRDLSPGAQIKCDLPYIKSEPVEKLVLDTVKGWVFNPGLLAEVLNSRRDASRLNTERTELSQVDAHLEELTKERQNVTRLYAKDLIDKVEGEKLLTDLKKRIDRLNERKQTISQVLNRAEATDPQERVDSLSETLDKLRELWDKLSAQDRKFAVRQLVQRVIIHGKDPVEWEVVPEP